MWNPAQIAKTADLLGRAACGGLICDQLATGKHGAGSSRLVPPPWLPPSCIRCCVLFLPLESLVWFFFFYSF